MNEDEDNCEDCGGGGNIAPSGSDLWDDCYSCRGSGRRTEEPEYDPDA